MIKALLFDKDGTLFDYTRTWSVWAKSFLLQISDNDPARAHELSQRIDFDIDKMEFSKSSVAIAGTPDQVVDALLPLLDHSQYAHVLATANQVALVTPQIEAVPLHPLLSEFRRREYVLGVMTNDSEQAAYAHLTQAGILDHFSFIAGYDSGFGYKPQSEPLLAFCDATDVLPTQTVMVGDSSLDLIAGRDAGMMTIGVLTGMEDEESLAPLADAILPHIGHIPNWIDEMR